MPYNLECAAPKHWLKYTTPSPSYHKKFFSRSKVFIVNFCRLRTNEPFYSFCPELWAIFVIQRTKVVHFGNQSPKCNQLKRITNQFSFVYNIAKSLYILAVYTTEVQRRVGNCRCLHCCCLCRSVNSSSLHLLPSFRLLSFTLSRYTMAEKKTAFIFTGIGHAVACRLGLFQSILVPSFTSFSALPEILPFLSLSEPCAIRTKKAEPQYKRSKLNFQFFCKKK